MHTHGKTIHLLECIFAFGRRVQAIVFVLIRCVSFVSHQPTHNAHQHPNEQTAAVVHYDRAMSVYNIRTA